MSNKRWIAGLCGVVLLLAAGAVLSTIGQAPATTTQQRKTSTPYTGDLSIFDYPDRDQKLHINQVMDRLGISPGKSVADIGAGSGWFTVRAAQRVAPKGTVYAVDINPEAIQYVDDRAKKEKLNNVKTVLGTAGDRKRRKPWCCQKGRDPGGRVGRIPAGRGARRVGERRQDGLLPDLRREVV